MTTESEKKPTRLDSPVVVTAESDSGSSQEDKGDDGCCDKIFGCCCCKAMEKASDILIRALENMFYWIGYAIGAVPWLFIICGFVAVFIFLPGVFLYFEEETDPTNLWTPLGITARDHKAWVDDYYSDNIRFENLIFESSNVLTPAVILKILEIDQRIKAISTNDYSWESLCFNYNSICLTSSILEVWSYDNATIHALTQSDILDAVNNPPTISPVYGNNLNLENLLGEITRDDSGQITGARATSVSYFLNVSDPFNVPENGKEAKFEQKMIDIVDENHDGVTIHKFLGRSFGDEAGGAILGDINLLSAGYVLVIVFVCVALGKYSCIQHKIYVTLSGILCIGLSLGITMGLCAYAGIDWGPLHNVLPFLVLGIGVDDMFVIVQCWENLSPETHSKPIKERIGLTMKHAGMSITVTSITDILAFAVGATTILPALRSFCIYSAICIGTNFILQATLFTACLAIDQRRAEAGYNACCCCYKHTDHKPSRCHDKSLVTYIFENFYAPTLMKLPVKIVVVVVALGLFAGGLYGTTQIEQFFDERWFIPGDSYLSTYFDKRDVYFPDDGLLIGVYKGEAAYFGKYDELEALYNASVTNQYTQEGSVESWFHSYHIWLSDNAAEYSSRLDMNNYPNTEADFYYLLNIFLYNETFSGGRFIPDLVFENGVIVASRMSLVQPLLSGSSDQIRAMDSVRGVCNAADLGTDCFAYTAEFLSFEGNRVIQDELFRNLGLAFLCVVIMTLILLANFWTCFLVSVVVVMSLVNVMGYMHYWNLTIDTVTTINMIIAIGLTVDYSAHIAHTFMTETGTRNERVMATLSLIGPAVFYGGFSTFLAFILLSASKSYVFTTFFKIFLLVVLWGLFHGLAVLPVLLSWVGPPPYLSAKENAVHGHKRKLAHQKTGKVDSDAEAAANGSVAKSESNGMANPSFVNDNSTPRTVSPNQVQM